MAALIRPRWSDVGQKPTLGKPWVLAASWTYSINVTEIDFTDLGSYSDLMVMLRAVTTDAAQQRSLRVSTNNGSSYYAGATDYQSVAATGVETAATSAAGLSATTSAAATVTFLLPGCNVSGVPKLIQVVSSVVPKLFVGSTDPINAVRIVANAANFTGGNVYVFGRPFI
jgi:hypothetical protein